MHIFNNLKFVYRPKSIQMIEISFKTTSHITFVFKVLRDKLNSIHKF